MADALAELETLCGCRAGARMNGRERVNLRRIASERGAWLDAIHVSAANPVLVRFAETLWQPLMGVSGAGRLTGDDVHPFGQRLAEAVAAGENGAIEDAARSLVEACVAAWFVR
jgi:DNA-binding FadR family transcriptional regulator